MSSMMHFCLGILNILEPWPGTSSLSGILAEFFGATISLPSIFAVVVQLGTLLALFFFNQKTQSHAHWEVMNGEEIFFNTFFYYPRPFDIDCNFMCREQAT